MESYPNTIMASWMASTSMFSGSYSIVTVCDFQSPTTSPTPLRRRTAVCTVAIQHDGLRHALLLVLTRQADNLADGFDIVGGPVEKHGYDQYGHNDEYDRSDNALFQCSVH